MRRKPSLIDLEIEEEKKFVSVEEMSLLEPRPRSGGAVTVGSIFEVLDGRV